MNLRTLKKLSKRAAPLLPIFGDDREQFRAEPYANYGVPFIGERKHWERCRVHDGYVPLRNWVGRGDRDIGSHIYRARSGHLIAMKPPTHPRKGTMMVGAMSGYYEPEWDEQTAWSALCDFLHIHYTDWREDGDCPLLRPLDTVAEIFAAAQDAAAEITALRQPGSGAGR